MQPAGIKEHKDGGKTTEVVGPTMPLPPPLPPPPAAAPAPPIPGPFGLRASETGRNLRPACLPATWQPAWQSWKGALLAH